MILPPKVLIKNGTTKNNAAKFFPIINLAMGKANKPPKIPVPNISPATAKDIFLVFLYISPAIKAPIILPGKANREPVPNIFLISEIQKAMATA